MAGAIFFYETSEEAPDPAIIRYHIRNLAAQGILQNLNGILLGRPGGQIPAERHAEYGHEMIRVLAEEGLVDMPVLANMDFGHTDPIMTLPYGVMAEIDCERVELKLLESGVAPGPSLEILSRRVSGPRLQEI